MRVRAIGALAAVVVVAGCAAPLSPTSLPTPSTSSNAFISGPVDIGDGRVLFLECAGTGTPTVILESGLHESANSWIEATPIPPAKGPDVFTAIAEHTTVCRYDRPGTIIVTATSGGLTTRSTPVANPRTIDDMAADVQALIDAAGLEGPFIGVGHSMGGWVQTYFAQTHPDQVAGLVLVDAFSERIPEFQGSALFAQYEPLMNGLGGDPLGDDPASEQVDVLASAAITTQAPPLRDDLPMVVISKGGPFVIPDGLGFTGADLDVAWDQVQNALAHLVTNTPHIIATGSDHNVEHNDPDLVVAAVLLVIERAG